MKGVVCHCEFDGYCVLCVRHNHFQFIPGRNMTDDVLFSLVLMRPVLPVHLEMSQKALNNKCHVSDQSDIWSFENRKTYT